MAYDLRRAAWLPLRTRGGVLAHGTIASIVARIDDDPVLAIASGRPDFDGAVTEFLIGLLTAAFMVENEPAWRKLWSSPPSESELQARLDALPDAFSLDGDGPRFLQDLSVVDLADQDIEPVQELLVNAKNSGLFIKPGTTRLMSRSAAAMALITMQSYSTKGGRGYRTSVRGGGPLTTLVDPRKLDDAEASLWHFLWANVETLEQLEARSGDEGKSRAPRDIYPWLAPTRTSVEKGSSTTPTDAHPLQAYFGMPRRIRLEFAETPGICDISGQGDDRMVVGFCAKSYGVMYRGWHHPLSPYKAGEQPNEWRPIRGQPGGVGWRDWLSLLFLSDAAPGKKPAYAVSHFGSRRAERVGLTQHALRVFGYDASNAKIRAWISSTLPAFAPTDPERAAAVAVTVGALVDATDKVAYVLQSAVAEAVHAADTPGDLSYVKAAVWSATESWFYHEVGQLVNAAGLDTAAQELKTRYRPFVADAALRIFDATAPSDATKPEVLRRIIRARFGLVLTLGGNGKMGEQIFTALGLVAPGELRKRKSSKSPTGKRGVK